MDGYRIIKPEFALAPYEPRYDYTISSATGHSLTQEMED